MPACHVELVSLAIKGFLHALAHQLVETLHLLSMQLLPGHTKTASPCEFKGSDAMSPGYSTAFACWVFAY